VYKKILKNSFILLLIFGGLLAVRYVFAQDFGTNEVSSGLGGSLAQGDPRAIVGRIINIALGFLGAIALGLIIYAGFLWMTSEGNEEKVLKAKKTLTSAAIGLAIVLASWAIATFVINQLSGATNGNPNGDICTDGSVISCGCGGAMYCVDNSWGGCIGSDCGPGGPDGPSSCDASANPGCQANNNICAPQDYCDDGCVCLPRGTAGDFCDGDIDTSTCDADNNLCGEFLSCDINTCTCAGPPVITGISPAGGFCEEDNNKSCQSDIQCELSCNKVAPNGAAGNLISIFGNSFGEYQEGGSQVIFSNNQIGRNPIEINPVCVNFWTNEQIVIAVPSGVSSGNIKVIRADGAEDVSDNDYGPVISDFVANNIVRPGLCAISPETGLLGAEFVYQGINLYSGLAYFGNYSTNIQALSSNFSHPSGLSGQANMPNIRAGDSDSFVISQVGGNQEASNFVRVSKEADPNEGAYIVSFSPSEGRSGQYVTINGSGFGGAQGSSKVYFGSTEADYVFPAICAVSIWKDNQVIVKVPENIENGSYFIKLDINGKTIDTSELNPNVFQINDSYSLKTSICKLEPSAGTIGTPVRVYGEYFGDENREGLVSFYNNKSISGTIQKENNADVISVEVPEGAITGPVKVVKNNQWGNELNFEVSSCTSNDSCSGQVCCPANTYKKGRCVDALADCLIDIPTSVFEWDFSTGYSSGPITDPTETCGTLASYYGACQTGISCPNASGVCSPYSGGLKQVVGECDFSCASVDGCGGGLGSSTCTYDANTNKCIKDGSGGLCSLPQTQVFTIAEQEYELNMTCNSDGNWQTVASTSCPDNFEKGINNICVDKNSSCDLCELSLTCQKVGASGRCVSETICPLGSECEDNPDVGSLDSCVALDEASCDCCCRIGNSAQDCCAPLECGGTCGSDTSDDGAGFGVCSGCAGVGDTQAEQDAACNCAITSGQFCTSNESAPQGICTDCSGLKDKESCDAHSSVCCFDAQANVCRGGSGVEISDNPSHRDYGYCAYFNCDSTDPTTCASATPVKNGYYKSVYACEEGCLQGGGDICTTFDGNKDDCTQVDSCCYDFDTNTCQGGDKILSGDEVGYCAYYDCGDPSAIPPGDPELCNEEAKTSGTYSSISTCSLSCGNNSGGSGKACVSEVTVSECNFDVCNYPSMACLTESGQGASDISDCGTCCCDPKKPSACQTDDAPDLYCQPNVGSCSGDGRGLCCGCTQDSDCGNAATVGCGIETCCQARPSVVSSVPISGADNVCRNAVMQITFDTAMDISSFNSNSLLLQEMTYSTGVCPAGTFVYSEDSLKQPKGIAKIFKNIKVVIRNIFSELFVNDKQAFAQLHDPSKLYCASGVNISGENMNNQTVINILPKKLLTPETNYFIVIKGDEGLNSQTGVISANGIGLNGEGLESVGDITEGEYLKFNNNFYINSHIVQFKTLSDKELNSGVCEIDHVLLKPSSYLFQTTENSLDENDTNILDKSFDTKSDRDKVFSAWAYSSDSQVIQPVTGYFWEWKFDLIDSDVAKIEPISGLSSNRVLVEANAGVTDAETRLEARVDMERFLGGLANDSPACVCTDDVCSSNCLNAFSKGGNLSTSSNIYVFLCNNPWPPLDDSGWNPWSDNCDYYVGDGVCTDFSYKFYYCRDAGEPGTFDDLPAISNQAVIRGESAILACSSDSSTCSNINTSCGADRNGDGEPDGICIWSVLKESYFFREQVLSPGNITNIIDTEIGGEVLMSWQSESDKVVSYKVYYGEEGKAISSSREITKEQAGCQLNGSIFNCQAKISNLDNNKTYAFRLSVISENESESILSSTKTVTPTDKAAPLVPINFNIEDLKKEDMVRFTWSEDDSDAAIFRLYRGISSGLYGESYDSNNNVKSISLDKSSLTEGINYFAVSAVDTYDNESAKSGELTYFYQPPGNIISIVDTEIGGEVLISWQSGTNKVVSYKIYYEEEGEETGSLQEVTKEQAACQLIGSSYDCQANISNLENNKTYVFSLSVISEDGSESILSNTKTATPTEKTTP